MAEWTSASEQEGYHLGVDEIRRISDKAICVPLDREALDGRRVTMRDAEASPFCSHAEGRGARPRTLIRTSLPIVIAGAAALAMFAMKASGGRPDKIATRKRAAGLARSVGKRGHRNAGVLSYLRDLRPPRRFGLAG